MALVHRDSTKIDHFSSLPNEILQDILEQSWLNVHHQITCKRLLPFVRSITLRRVALFCQNQLARFSQAILADGLPGQFVKMLSIDNWNWHTHERREERRQETITMARKLRRILYLLPNLESFTQCDWMDSISALPLIGAPLPNLRNLDIAFPPIDNNTLDLNDFQWIAALPSLTSLRIDHWNEYDECYISPGITFPHLQKLEIEGCGAADFSVGVLASVCPSLVQVSLITHRSPSPSFDRCLPSFPLSLERLYLSSEEDLSVPVNPLLLRFHHLTHINLGKRTASSTIHLTLLQLPNLVSICLADGPWDLQGLQQLVEGPHRLPKLQEFGFDYADCYVEGRFDPEVVQDLETFKTGTYLAFDRWHGDFNDWLRMRELIRACERNGITMEGLVTATVGAIDAFILETYNLAIARTYYLSDPSTLQHAQSLASTHSFPLPRLDYDGTNLEEMDLIKTEREEQEWFALTLRKRTV